MPDSTIVDLLKEHREDLDNLVENLEGSPQHWICPTCQVVTRAQDKPRFCPECGAPARELSHVKVVDK